MFLETLLRERRSIQGDTPAWFVMRNAIIKF